MKVIRPDSISPGPPSEEKIRVLAARAKAKVPLFQPHDTPDSFEEHEHYLQLKSVHAAIGYYLGMYRAFETDDDAEVIFTQIAKIIGGDPSKPKRYAHQLPLPCSMPKIKTSKFVWKWHEVKPHVRRMMTMMAIKKLAKNL